MSIPNDLSDTGSALYPYEQYALEVIGMETSSHPPGETNARAVIRPTTSNKDA
jgi:hypothetical protein